MANSIPGKAFYLSFQGIEFNCVTDLNFTATAETNTDDVCKPNSTEPYEEAPSQQPSVSSKSWTADGTFNVTDELANNQIDVLNTIKVGTRDEIRIYTHDGVGSPLATVQEVSGDAILTEFALGAPIDGQATYTLTFVGYGDYTVTAVPRTT